MQGLVARHIEGLAKFPPRHKPAAFNLDEVLRKVQGAVGSGSHERHVWTKQDCLPGRQAVLCFSRSYAGSVLLACLRTP